MRQQTLATQDAQEIREKMRQEAMRRDLISDLNAHWKEQKEKRDQANKDLDIDKRNKEEKGKRVCTINSIELEQQDVDCDINILDMMDENGKKKGAGIFKKPLWHFSTIDNTQMPGPGHYDPYEYQKEMEQKRRCLLKSHVRDPRSDQWKSKAKASLQNAVNGGQGPNRQQRPQSKKRQAKLRWMSRGEQVDPLFPNQPNTNET